MAAVTGRIVDEADQAVGGALMQMCVRRADGIFVCLAPEPAREDGHFAQVIPATERCMERLSFRSLLPGSSYGTTYCQSELAADDGLLTLPEPMKLYEVTPAPDLPPEGDPTQPRTVTIADGLDIEVTPDVLFGGYEELGGALIDQQTCFTDGPLDGLYALTPEAATYRLAGERGGFSFRIATALPEGTPVDFFVLGGLDEFELATGVELTEGGFERFGSGRVEDGVVVNDPGSELPYLSWLGYRARE